MMDHRFRGRLLSMVSAVCLLVGLGACLPATAAAEVSPPADAETGLTTYPTDAWRNSLQMTLDVTSTALVLTPGPTRKPADTQLPPATSAGPVAQAGPSNDPHVDFAGVSLTVDPALAASWTTIQMPPDPPVPADIAQTGGDAFWMPETVRISLSGYPKIDGYFQP